MNVEEGLQLTDLRGILRRRWGVMVNVAAAVFLGSVVLAALLPNRYEAWTTILVEPQKISKELVEAGIEDTDLNARLHLMATQILSRPRLSKIIDEFHLYPNESKRKTREEVIDLMREGIRVEPVLPELTSQLARQQEIQINTFRIFYEGETAKLAAAVISKLANDFVDEHIKERVEVSGDTSDFIERELGRLATKIQEVEARIAQVKAESPGTLPEDLDYNRGVLARTLSDLRTTQSELDIARSDLAFYQQQFLAARALGTTGGDLSPAQRLELLKLQLGEFRSRGFTDKHPDVISTQQEIASLEEFIETGLTLDEEDLEKRRLSFAEQSVAAEYRRAELRVQSAETEVTRLQQQTAEYEERISKTPRVAERLEALDREHEHLFKSYQDFSQRRLEAGVAANVEKTQKGEQVRIIEASFEPPEPSFPNRLLILVLGLFLGLAIGGAVGVLLEVTDTSFHGGRELQSALGIPVLAAIPPIWFDADLAARRRRRLFRAFAGALLVLAVLVGSAGGYWWVNIVGKRAVQPPAESPAAGVSAGAA